MHEPSKIRFSKKWLYTCIHVHVLHNFKTWLGVVRTNANSQWNPGYKVFHGIFCSRYQNAKESPIWVCAQHQELPNECSCMIATSDFFFHNIGSCLKNADVWLQLPIKKCVASLPPNLSEVATMQRHSFASSKFMHGPRSRSFYILILWTQICTET